MPDENRRNDHYSDICCNTGTTIFEYDIQYLIKKYKQNSLTLNPTKLRNENRPEPNHIIRLSSEDQTDCPE